MSDGLKYNIKKPKGWRKTYALTSYTGSGSKRSYLSIEERIQSEVNQINKHFLSNVITAGQAETLLQEIIKREYAKQGKGLNSSKLITINQQIFDKFWEEVYSIRYLDDADSARYETLNAFRLIEPLSIQTATQIELQTKLRGSGASLKQIRRATTRINQVLKWLKRDLRLQKPKPETVPVQHLKFDEFIAVRVFMEDEVARDLATTLFASGLRLSEALALTPSDFKDGIVNVEKQKTRKVARKLPKAGKKGKSFVLPFGHEAIVRWTSFQNKELYRYKLYGDLIEACQKAFPDQREKWCSPHDLRHSHAIYLLGQGASLTQVALNLRNRMDVCQMYYTGFAHSDESLEHLRKIIIK